MNPAKKIKVLRIIARLNIGGPAIHTILLTEGLDKDKFVSLLVYGSLGEAEGDMLYYARKMHIDPLFIPELKRELNFSDDLKALIKIYKIILREKPDIIHTHTAKAGALGRLAGIIYNLQFWYSPKIKLFHTFHGHVFEGYFGKLKSSVFIIIERVLAAFTSKIITVSDAVAKELVDLGIAGASKIKVIPLGFELNTLLNMDLRKSDMLNIGIVGRLVSVKNHCLFIEAAARVIKNNPGERIGFKIIGDGELKNDLKEYAAKLGLTESVDFLGWRYGPVEIYEDLDIVVLTSLNEGTPVSLIEAMASGRAVVATEVGGIRDLLGEPRKDWFNRVTGFEILERGLVVKTKEVTDFSAALEFIINQPDLRKDMGASGRRFVKEKFSKERLIQDIETLYLA
jgi:glycosyltransferase involved in cell wall biosynthesis